MGWLDDYIHFTHAQESPTVFHRWVGISIIASTLGRDVWLDRRSDGVTRYKVYPGQLIIVLVAGSGRSRKSVGLNMSQPFLKAGGVRTIRGKSSPEAFLDELSGKGVTPPPKDHSALLLLSEMSAFLSKQSYSEPLLDILMDLADAPDYFPFNTRGGGKIELKNVCLSGLMASTPISIGEAIPARAHSAGFLSRVMWIYAAKTDRINPLIDFDDEFVDPAEIQRMEALKQDLFHRIKYASTMKGPFSVTKEAKDWYVDWYKNWVESPQGQGEGYPTRRGDHLLRVAMCIAVSERGDREITLEDLTHTDAMLCDVEQHFDKVFLHIGHSQNAKNFQRIVDAITVSGGVVPRNHLIKMVYKYFNNIEELSMTLRTLEAAGELKRGTDKMQSEFWWLPDHPDPSPQE